MASSRATLVFIDESIKTCEFSRSAIHFFESALENDEKWCRVINPDGSFSMINLRLVREIRIEYVDD